MSTIAPPPRGLGKLFTKDDPFGVRREDSRDAQVRQLAKKVGVSAAPIRLSGLKFIKGATGITPLEVAHLLGRPPQGYRIVKLVPGTAAVAATAALSVQQGTAQHPDKHINLTCNDVAGSATGDHIATADVEVW